MTQAWRSFGYLLPALGLILVVALPAIGLLSRRRVHKRGESWPAALLAVAIRGAAIGSPLGVLAITLTPSGHSVEQTAANLVPFASIIDQVASSVDASVPLRNLGGNVLLFLPIGISWTPVVTRAGHTWLTALAGGSCFSVAIELGQFFLPVGRAVDVDDVILNSLGVLIGVLFARASYATVGGFLKRRA